ncbi:hypothetical protein [Pantoea ananatis]|uniref:hypothetical protein n=1 Tax=Pantoea ananas TaxID=553 RepID=UPI000CF41E02|nr:hypothetical protein [Pantoea ananatis]PQK76348.1 hypothetical protein CG427_06205 [Pantoea ananatis]
MKTKVWYEKFSVNYCKIVNETSGLIALGILQSVVMTAVRRQREIKGLDWHPIIFWSLFVASTLVMVLTAFSTGNAILSQPGLGKFERLLLLVLFELVFIGALLSAVITVKSL